MILTTSSSSCHMSIFVFHLLLDQINSNHLCVSRPLFPVRRMRFQPSTGRIGSCMERIRTKDQLPGQKKWTGGLMAPVPPGTCSIAIRRPPVRPDPAPVLLTSPRTILRRGSEMKAISSVPPFLLNKGCAALPTTDAGTILQSLLSIKSIFNSLLWERVLRLCYWEWMMER